MIFPKIDKKRTGVRIRRLMENAGIKPAYIARYLSLGCVQTIYRWFEGVNIPTIDNLYALSSLFGVTVDDMLVGTNRGRLSDYVIDSNVRVLIYYKRIMEAGVV